MESYSKIFLDENHDRVKMEMGEGADSYEKGNSYDLDFQYESDGEDIEDKKTEIMDIVHHYTDEKGIRLSFKYETGDFAFNQKSNLEGHIDAVHLNEREHKCHLCGFAANQKSNLKIHIDSVHLNIKELKCHLCEYAASKNETLQNHIDDVHLNKKEHICSLCDYAANQKVQLKIHMVSVHLNKREHKCSLCNYAANHKSYLENHIYSVHLNIKEFECHLCEYAASKKDTLQNHIDCVHLNKKEHKCHLCNYAANRKVYLKKHIDSAHLNIKEFECHLCEYAASTKDTLQNHIDSNISELLYFKMKTINGAETRAETSTTERILQTTEMETLRTITGYKLVDRQRNSVIREKCQVDHVVRWIRKRLREWNQYVDRMRLGRMAKTTRDNKPLGRRTIGRPPKQ
ncbi:zinc finger protein 596-like [Harmonia axyridis]|uniref:zinc finger protein 596-like n=1 Tax=Harmonia axyridis TaxID=115357 RepID=UPI001E27850A|nr:zinc finger protein 596-like [Harmonia axyridis]